MARRSAGGALVVLTATTLALAAAARATIVPQRAMAGIDLGMTKAQVERAAGKPLRIEHATARARALEQACP